MTQEPPILDSQNESHPLDWNAKLVRFFFDNAKLVWLLIIMLLIGGVFSLLSLRKEGFPSFEIKTVFVQTIYPGATSSEVENKVTRELEASIKEVSGIKEYASVSQNSFSQIVVSFNEDVDLNKGISDLQNKLVTATSKLPKEAEAPKVQNIDATGPAFLFSVTSGQDINATKADAALLAQEIASVDGVNKAETGENKREIHITVDPAKLRQTGVTLAVLNQVLQANNLNYPVGTVEMDGKQQSILTLGSFKQLSDLENVILGANPVTKTPIYLKDVATVTEENAAPDQIERVGFTQNGSLKVVPGVQIAVKLNSDADIIKTKTKILDRIETAQTEGRLSADLKYSITYDQATQTQNQIAEIVSGALGSKDNLYLLGGLQLLFIAMLLLVNWRAALIAALSIPLALAFTFISLLVLGVQLNTIVLFSLVLVLGLIVDPAIVMVEAVQRYRDLKYSARDSVIESARRYGASLFMAVLTSLLVFVPFGVVGGYFGEIIRYLPLTIIPALVASYLVPVAILPYLSKKLLKQDRHDQDAAVFGDDENLSKLANWVMRVNRWILQSKPKQIVIVLATIFLIGASLSLVATQKIQIVQFSTPEDNTMLIIQAKYEKGFSLAQKTTAVEGLEQLLVKETGIKEFFFAEQNQNGFSMYVNLKDKVDRGTDTDRSKAIVSRLQTGSTNLSGFLDVLVSEIAMGPPTNDYQISTNLESNDLTKLESAAVTVGKYLGNLEHVTKVDDGFTNKLDQEVHLTLNAAKVQAQGLSSYEVGTQLKAVLDHTTVGKLVPASGDPLDIVLATNQDPASLEAIGNLPLLNRSGQTLKVSDLATVEESKGVSAIQHYNGKRYATVQARVDKQENVLKVQDQFDQYLTDAKLKELGIESKLTKGDIGDITKSFTDLAIAMVIAILLTYVVLVLQFRSFSLPVIMLFTIPLSLIGVFPILYLTGSQFGFLELLGITILIGIVENVAIFLIDYANQLVKEKGLTPKEAIIQASGVRFRPILLTKLVTLGGLLPLAIESPMWRGLSVVIIAGIGLSGFFSLVIIPIFYVFLMKLRLREPRLRKKRA